MWCRTSLLERCVDLVFSYRATHSTKNGCRPVQGRPHLLVYARCATPTIACRRHIGECTHWELRRRIIVLSRDAMNVRYGRSLLGNTLPLFLERLFLMSVLPRVLLSSGTHEPCVPAACVHARQECWCAPTSARVPLGADRGWHSAALSCTRRDT